MDMRVYEALKDRIRKIAAKFSNQQYQVLSGDTYFNNVPYAIRKLWYSDENENLALCNVWFYLNKCLEGTLLVNEFEAMLNELEDSFKTEFGLL